MANPASYEAAAPRTINLTAAAVSRGVRVALNGSGLCAAAAVGVRGDFVTAQAGAASESIAAFGTQSGRVPALASEAVAVGDTAYSAASGKFSKTSTNAVLMGVWTLAASGDGVLGEVELQSVR